jgi:hypothetical protein
MQERMICALAKKYNQQNLTEYAPYPISVRCRAALSADSLSENNPNTDGPLPLINEA